MDAERDWVRRVREGEVETYRLLVERYQSRIHRLVSRLLGAGHGDIEDVVQEVFVKAYFSLNKFRGDSSFGTWITRIAINRARDELRRRPGNQIPFEEEVSPAVLDELESYLHEQDAENPRPPKRAAILNRLVTRAVASLPELMRVVVTLKDMEGLSYQEVSQILKCSVGTVKSRHARARKRLRQALSRDVPELMRREP